MKFLIDILLDSLIDVLKLLPFLFIAYLIMEYIEHKTNKKVETIMKKSGKFGPLVGSVLGMFPQCGFSAIGANLYSSKLISLGTLIAIFLSTSDEMLPILISESVEISVILKLLFIKLIVGIIFGFIIDFVLNKINSKKETISDNTISHICEHEHCGCEHGIMISAIKHTFSTFIYIFIVTLILTGLFELIGEENISNFITSIPVLGPVIAGLIGLIPNCAASVILTQLYISGTIPVSTLISGLLVGAGVGILILFKYNKPLKNNLKIISLLYSIGVFVGIFLEFISFVI